MTTHQWIGTPADTLVGTCQYERCGLTRRDQNSRYLGNAGGASELLHGAESPDGADGVVSAHRAVSLHKAAPLTDASIFTSSKLT